MFFGVLFNRGQIIVASLLLASSILPWTAFSQESFDEDARAYLAELAARPAITTPRSGRMAIFARAQLKYGLERADYLHRWGDRPLLQDTSFQDRGQFTVEQGSYSDIGFLNPLSYRAMTEVLRRFDIDGFAFFPHTKGRRDLYRHCGTPGATIAVLPEFVYGGNTPPDTTIDPAQLEPFLELAAEALASPQVYRLGGKVVFTSYPNPGKGNDLIFWGALKKALQERLGDHFLLMPGGTLTHINKTGGRKAPYSRADVVAMQEELRRWLRVVDGYYHNSPSFINRRYDWDMDRKFVIPLLHSVLSEPEFQSKYIGWGTKVGHMNCQLLGYSLDAFGTDMLRGTVDAALLARADIVNLVEWDEENENTCFRPTINTSFSTGRIIRFFAGQSRGEAPSMLPGDDPSVPNLIISSRRILSAGEALEIEVTHVPDGTATVVEYTLNLSLLNQQGQIAHQFPARKIATAELQATVFTVATPELLRHQVLFPLLTVTGGGQSRTFQSGLQPIELRASWNWDYIWIKQPLRDLDQNTRTAITARPASVEGAVEITVQAESASDLRSVEIVEGCDVIYSHSELQDYRETTDEVAIAAVFQASMLGPATISGAVRWHGAPSLRLRNPQQWPPQNLEEATAWTFGGESITHWAVHRHAKLRRADIAAAEIEVDLPGLAQGRLKVADLVRLGTYGFSGPHGFNAVFRVYCSQVSMPPPLRQKSAQFTILARPARPNSVFYVQTVNDKFQIHRGAVYSLYKPSGQAKSCRVFSVADNSGSTIAVDHNLLMPFSYNFSPERGSVFHTSGNSELLGVLGGYTPQATGVAAGESNYGNPMAPYIAKQGPENFPNLVPKHCRDEQGRWVLEFDGGNYISVPLGAVPAYGAYDVEMEVMPFELTGTQTLFGNDSPGFVLSLRNEVATAGVYCNQTGEHHIINGPALIANQWNKIKVSFDQQHFSIAVNGVQGEKIVASGYQRYPRAYTVGAHYRFGNFFKGRIAKLEIIPK